VIPPSGQVASGLSDASIEVVGAPGGFAELLVASLKRACMDAIRVDVPSIGAEAIIQTCGLTGAPAASAARAISDAGLIAPRFEERGGLFVTLQDTGGGFRPDLSRAWHGGITGLARTAVREWPKANVRAIDIALQIFGEEMAAERIVEELLNGGNSPCVGLGPQGRLVPAQDLVQLSSSSKNRPAITGDSVLLVTGGARGVTAECVIALARETGARLALVGRSALTDWPEGIPVTKDEKTLRGALARVAAATGGKQSPERIGSAARLALGGQEIRSTLERLAEHGAARYYPADVSDCAAIADTIAKVEQDLGRITGVIHGAGVLADKRLRAKTPTQVAKVFAPKLDGLKAIFDVLDPGRLDHIAFFSSVAARYGNVGQADYAVANETLNRLAWALKDERPDAGIVSINWGPWDGGMVDDTLRAHFTAQGMSLIGREEGAALFTRAMRAGAGCPVELTVRGAMHDVR